MSKAGKSKLQEYADKLRNLTAQQAIADSAVSDAETALLNARQAVRECEEAAIRAISHDAAIRQELSIVKASMKELLDDN